MSPIHVKDPVLGPGAETAAKLLYENAPEDPDVVIVIYSKNITPSEGRTAVGTASVGPMTDEIVALIVKNALKSLKP